MSREKVLTGFAWRFLERFGAQAVSLIVSIVLARLLAPEVYGTVALIMVFTNILQVFIDAGFGTALVQKKDADNLDFSTVFYFNLVVCAVLYGVMFFIAPFIANFYNNSDLTILIRVVSLTLLISGVKNVQQAYVSRHMMFKKFFFSTLGGTIAAGAVGIFMAYKGYGVWALVAQYLVNALIDTIVLWIVVKWRPEWKFSFKRLKSLFSYGWKLLVSKLFDKAMTEVRSLIIGKKYSSSDLAYYNRGETYPNMLISNVDTALDSVLLPSMSKEQEDPRRVKEMARKSIRMSSYIIVPAMVGFALVAEPLVRIVLTEKWLPCVFFIQIFCINYMFWPIHTANVNAIKALGRSDIFLVIDIIKRVVGLIAIASTMWFGVKIMAIGLLASSILNQFINAIPNKKLLNYSIKEQLLDILPSFILSAVMGVVVYGVGFLVSGDVRKIIVQIIFGVTTYFALSVITKNKTLAYIKSVLKTTFRKK